MPLKVYDTATMSEAEWLLKRKECIGASEAAAAMGVSKWKSPQQLYLEKKGVLLPFEGNLKTKLGKYMEPFVKDIFKEETGKELQRRHAIFAHEKYHYMRCNLDYFVVGEKVPCEIKTTASRNTNEWEDQNIPSDYFWQLQHQMSVMDTKYAYLAVYFFSLGEFKCLRIDRCEESETAMIALEKRFWDAILEGAQPELNHADEELVNQRYQNADNENKDVINLRVDQYKDLITRRREVSKLIKTLELEKKGLDVQLKDAMGSYRYAKCENYRIQWKKSEQTTKAIFDEDRFQKDHPGMYGEYLKKEITRTMPYYRISTH